MGDVEAQTNVNSSTVQHTTYLKQENNNDYNSTRCRSSTAG